MARADARIDEPLQPGRMAVKIDAGDGALAHTDGGAAVAGDEAAQKLEEDGLCPTASMPSRSAYLASMFWNSAKSAVGSRRVADFHFGVVAKLGADKLCGLKSPLQGARDDHVHLHLEGAQHARHQHALVFAFLDEAPLGVENGVLAEHSGTGVAHEVEDHSEEFGEGGRSSSFPGIRY